MNYLTEMELAKKELKAFEIEYVEKKKALKNKVKSLSKGAIEEKISFFGLGKNDLKTKDFEKLTIFLRKAYVAYFTANKLLNSANYISPNTQADEKLLADDLALFAVAYSSCFRVLEKRINKAVDKIKGFFGVDGYKYFEIDEKSGKPVLCLRYKNICSEETLAHHSELLKIMLSEMKTNIFIFSVVNNFGDKFIVDLSQNEPMVEKNLNQDNNTNKKYFLNGNFLYTIYQDNFIPNPEEKREFNF